MKKALKPFLITLTVLGTIVVSGFFYYRHLEEQAMDECAETLSDINLEFDPSIWDINNK